MQPTNCVVCGKQLQGDLDTFGDTHLPMCWECWSDLENMDPDEEHFWDDYYMNHAPHLPLRQYENILEKYAPPPQEYTTL